MRRANHPCLGVGEQDRGAVGGEDRQQDAGAVGGERIGARALAPRLGDDDAIGGVNLIGRDQRGICDDRVGGGLAVGERGGIIGIGERHIACRAAEETVRNAQPARLPRAHSARRMMRSSSIWSPTLNW